MGFRELIHFSDEDITTEYITYSSFQPNRALLSKSEITQLYQALQIVDWHFYQKTSWGRGVSNLGIFAVDVEFKFDKNNKLYLKQARPYE